MGVKEIGMMISLFVGRLKVLLGLCFLKRGVRGKGIRRILHRLVNVIMIHLRLCKDHFKIVNSQDFDTDEFVFLLRFLND